MGGTASAQQEGFSLQVSPSPVIQVLKPGEKKDIEIKIKNNAPYTEKLKAELRRFKIDSKTGEVEITDESPAEVVDWVKIESREFSIDPGAWYTQRLRVNVREDAGFSYSFALMLTRASNEEKKENENVLVGSVAVFVLMSIDKPGATKEFKVTDFKSSKKLYDYLPAEFSVKLSNSGNTMLLPYGNIYIQRGAGSDEVPLAVLPLNKNSGYLLPGVDRVFRTHWEDGFPRYELKKEADNLTPTSKLIWDFGKIQNLRIGKYTAKLVAVYNDGTRDVPIESAVTFWVLPWQPILLGIVILALVVVGLLSTGRSVFGFAKKGKKRRVGNEKTS